MFSANTVRESHFKLINISQTFYLWCDIDRTAEERRTIIVSQDDAEPIPRPGVGHKCRGLRSIQPNHAVYSTIMYPLQCLSRSAGQTNRKCDSRLRIGNGLSHLPDGTARRCLELQCRSSGPANTNVGSSVTQALEQ